MKAQLLFTVIILLAFNQLRAQNWSPFYPSDTINYQTDTSSQIKYTIWIDSTTINGIDTVFHFNKIAIPCAGCHWNDLFGNQPQFLGHRLIKYPAGKYYFDGPEPFTILTLADTGTSWIWDTTNMVMATVSEIKQDSVMETIDIIKTISLSNGTEVLLSRSYGIIRFPETKDSNHSALLTGIENRGLGRKVMDFWDIFDFEVGRIMYNLEGFSGFQWGWGTEYTEYKREILGRRVIGDTLIYDVDVKAIKHIDTGWPNYVEWKEYYDYIGEWIFINDPGGIRLLDQTFISTGAVNAYNNQLFPFGWPQDNFVRIVSTENKKKWNFHFQFASPNSDSLIWGNDNITWVYQTFERGLGETEFQGSYFESGESRSLLGYIKDGQSYGTIIPEDSFINPIEKPIEPGSIQFFPNPVVDFLQIQIENYQYLPADLRLRDLQGREVFYTKIDQSQERIPLPKLPKAWYLVVIIEKSGRVL